MINFFGPFISDNESKHIAGGVLLGFILGITPLFSIQALLITVCIFLLRVQILTTMLSFGIFALLSLLFNPLIDRIGLSILQIEQLEQLFSNLYHMPILPYSLFNHKTVMGAMTISICLGPLIYLLTYYLAQKYKKAPPPLPDKSTTFRLPAIIPLSVIIFVVLIYGLLTFDSSLEGRLERWATKVNGAKVSIEKLKSNLIDGTIQIWGLAINDQQNPGQDILNVTYIKCDLLRDALIRGKLVVEQARLKGISVSSTHTENNDQVDPIKKPRPLPKENMAISEKIKVEQKVEQLEQLLERKRKNWLLEVQSLSGQEYAQELLQRIESTKLAWKIKKAKRQLLSLKGDLRTIKDWMDKLKIEIALTENNISLFSVEKQQIDKLISDLKKLPKVQKSKSLPRKNLIKLLNVMTLKIWSYAHLLDKFLSSGGQQIIKSKRVHFIRKDAYPLFWLKKAKISSTPNLGKYSGDLQGEIVDISSHKLSSRTEGKISLEGHFPGIDLHGLLLGVSISQTDGPERLRQQISLKLKSFKYNQGHGAFNIQALVQGEQVDIELISSLNRFDNSSVIQMLQSGPLIQITAQAKGHKDQLDWSISKNLNQQFDASSLQDQMVHKFEQKKKRLGQRFAQIKEQINSILDKKSKESAAIYQRAQARILLLSKRLKKREKMVADSLRLLEQYKL